MRTLELTRAEWGRLAGTPLEAVLATLPADTRIVVVEDDAGAIVGQWACIRYVHVEGIWIAEAHRRTGSVQGRLLRAMRQVARSWGATVVLTGALDDDVRGYITRLGGARIPGDTFAFPVEVH